MAKLSQKEKEMLEALQAKAEAPDPPERNAVLNVSFDLGNEEHVKRAIKYGFLPADEEEEAPPDENEADTPPKRRGYFND